ncbi:hypothetical protein ACSSS7_001132 [Eimeria intestinalis]
MLCVHSKKHLSSDAAELEVQRTQNVRAMHALQQLLQEGGALVWVAPSGGRDRPDAAGVFSRADRFDVKALQSFCLLARRAKETAGRESLFCPMALWTAPICPPPNVVSATAAAKASAKAAAADSYVFLGFLPSCVVAGIDAIMAPGCH